MDHVLSIQPYGPLQWWSSKSLKVFAQNHVNSTRSYYFAQVTGDDWMLLTWLTTAQVSGPESDPGWPEVPKGDGVERDDAGDTWSHPMVNLQARSLELTFQNPFFCFFSKRVWANLESFYVFFEEESVWTSHVPQKRLPLHGVNHLNPVLRLMQSRPSPGFVTSSIAVMNFAHDLMFFV